MSVKYTGGYIKSWYTKSRLNIQVGIIYRSVYKSCYTKCRLNIHVGIKKLVNKKSVKYTGRYKSRLNIQVGI